MGRVQKYAILLLFCACTQLMAQSVASEMLYIEGFEAYSQLKYCRAYKCFSNAALVDHCGAKMMLGFLHLFGDCVEKDSTKAFQFFLELANSNIYVAKFMVGFCYQHGIGIGKDSLKAKEYYEDLLADYPLPEAHFMLARIEMFKGETASKHLKMAADKGHQQAAFQLGLNYLKNTTLKMNKIREAKKYFLESINFTQGSNESISSWGQRLNWER